MIISYKRLGKEITQKQAFELGDFEKIYTIRNGPIKQIEKYFDNRLAVLYYYLDDNETEEEAKAKLLPSIRSVSIRERESYGTYRVEKHKSYVNHVFKGATRHLYNAIGEAICYEEINMVTNQPDYQYTVKSLGTYDNEDEDIASYCAFYYHADGTFKTCRYNYFHEYDSDEFDLSTLPWIKDRFQLSDVMYNYYLTAQFLPPLE